MKKKNKNKRMQVLAALCIAGVLCYAAFLGEGDYKRQQCQKTIETIRTMLVKDRHSDSSSEQNAGTADGREHKKSWVTAVMEGDAGVLVGFPFGTEFDYDKFEYSGWMNESDIYRLRDNVNDDLRYTFDGEGHRFNGLLVSWDGDFFGWTLGEATLRTVLSQFGTPDSFGQKKGWDGLFVNYDFGRARLSVRIVEGKIRTVIYTAAGEVLEENAAPDVPTDFKRDMQAEHDAAETIYEWNCWLDKTHTDKYVKVHDEDYDDSQVDAFVEAYLQSQGIESMTPDGITALGGDSYVAYYIDRGQKKCCFILHMWGDYWVDYEAGISQYADAVYCAVCYFDEAEQTGNIICQYDAARGITQETLYDAWGKRMSDVSYAYAPGVPFPLVTDGWNVDEGVWNLCRNQKMWFYEEQAVLGENGRVTGTEDVGDMQEGKVYFPYECAFYYDKNNRLAKITEELQPYDIEKGWWRDCSGRMEFSYREDGSLEEAEYARSEYTHGGTTDSSGVIYYDEQGRMVYNEYYITHGADADIYLYEEGQTRPWARLDWCSSMPGIESVTIFVPVEE